GLLTGISANASGSASTNQSGAPSPYATTPLAMTNSGNTGSSIGHRRQLSSTFPAAMQQQQPHAMFVDTPLALSTAPPTLVPGTPTPFGQLQFHLHAQGAVPAALPLSQQHPHSSHFGHSRHLSLDAANLRLMAVDSSSLGGLALHETIQECPIEAVHPALHFGTAHQVVMAQQQQQQQMQLQQLQQFHQLQAQQKAGALMMRTVPATPLQHQSTNAAQFSSTPQLALLGDHLAQLQQQQQQLQSQQPQQRQHLFIHHHHSSASVDLGSLSSAFHHTAQFNQAISGHVSPHAVQPVMAVGIPMAHMYMPSHSPQVLHPPATLPLAPNTSEGSGSSRGAAATSPDESDADELDDEGDGISSGDEDDKSESKAVQVKRGKGTATPTSGGSATPQRTKVAAPYKRFRNSFIFFANEQRKQWRLQNPNEPKIQNRGFIQDMSKVWNCMSNEEKAPFIKMADEDKLRYETDVKKYGPLQIGNSSAANVVPSLTVTPLAEASLPEVVATPSSSGAHQAAVSSEPTKGRGMDQLPLLAPAPLPGIFSSNQPALEGISTISSESTQRSIPVQTASSVGQDTFGSEAAASSSLFVGGGVMCGAGEADSGMLSQAAYMALLQQTFGQDFSPHSIEFDPSCFVGSDPASSDEAACLNPQSLTYAGTEATSELTEMAVEMAEAVAASSALARAGSVASESSNAKVLSNGPAILTQVGTKRKSGSDGQPLTNLPSSIKRFRNSFIYYVNKKRREIQGTDDGPSGKVEVNNREFLKEMSGKWRTMSEDEKAPFTQMASADKERFTRQMREYEQEHPDEFGKNSKHRRRRSSTSGSNGSCMSVCAGDQQQGADGGSGGSGGVGPGSGGLNITLAGTADSAEMSHAVQDSQWAHSVGASLSTPLATPMVGKGTTLASVPEETVLCPETNGTGAGQLVTLSSLATVSEEGEDYSGSKK
ncbi:hypothetical protein EV174_004334, partial [Coemansia sp. RSA 2320]